MTSRERAYFAGLLDADGSIMLQLRKREQMRFHFRVKTVLVFYQDKKCLAQMQDLKQILQAGYLYIRNDRICEIRIEGFTTVQRILLELRQDVRFKRKQLDYMLEAISILQKKPYSYDDFMHICSISDHISDLNYSSKKRIFTSEYVRKYLENI